MNRTLTLTAALTLAACQRGPTPPSEGESGAPIEAHAPTRSVPAATARQDLPRYTVERLTEPPTVDGALDDTAWLGIRATDPFVHPGGGDPVPDSPVRGRAWMGYDDTALYVAFTVADSDAASPNDREAIDPHVWATASGIELMLQPGDPGDNTHYYEVQVDVAEAIWATQFDDYNAPITGDGDARQFGHQSWAPDIARAATVDGDGYVIEFALPWESIDSPHATAPPASGDTWRANLYTFRDGQRASLAWSALLGQGNFHRSARFGYLEFE